MPFVHGRTTTVLWDQYNLSAYLNSYEHQAEVDLPDTTTYGDTAHRHGVVGLKDGSMSFGGLFDASTGASHLVLSAAFAAGTANIVTVAKAGTTIGNPVEMAYVREKSYRTSAPVDGLVPVSAEATTDGGIDHGVSLHALSAEIATGDSVGVDNAVLTSNGGVAHLHATLVSGGTPSMVAKVQHSADDITYADLVTFAALAAAGKERVEVAAGTTVNRYTRASRTISGATPSFTHAVAFSRR